MRKPIFPWWFIVTPNRMRVTGALWLVFNFYVGQRVGGE